ncbi:uncharacterized protein LOC124285442 [Haliotis rubra]|uniref:uncharacterized protein LOC124285442 n=1 Tax=Haliotis rubra TaxID=36100 RepID=UPI001EE5AAAB|nr:uncharacterized protein LOC124285442 [Haliotis rubra]
MHRALAWLSQLASQGNFPSPPPAASRTNISSPQSLQSQLPLTYPVEVIGSHVKEAVRQKILNGEYVDFRNLLPSDNQPLDDHVPLRLVSDSNGQVLFKPYESHTARPLTISAWTTAFHIFMGIYVSKHADRVQELLSYAETIRGAAFKHGGDSWATYDYHLRHKMARDPARSWGKIDGDLWLKCMLPGKKTMSPSIPSFSKTSKGDDNVCWDFNRSQCTRSVCKFPHRCSKCQSFNHGARSCQSSLFRSRNAPGTTQQHHKYQNASTTVTSTGKTIGSGTNKSY